MPVFSSNDYKVDSFLFKNAYFQTLFAKFFRPVNKLYYRRERIPISKENFLDLDWSCVSSKKLVIVTDGLEGNSKRHYVRGVVKACNDNAIDALAINFRGCSGVKSHDYFLQYGETDDLSAIIQHVLKSNNYEEIYLAGCSVGGNLILEYLGKKANDVDKRIKKAFVVSATVHLDSSCAALHKPENWFYLKGFLFALFLRVWLMRKTFQSEVKFKDFFAIKTFKDFYYHFVYQQKKVTLEKYFEVNSSWDTLHAITIPSCLLYSKDDPFLDSDFYPLKEASENPNLSLYLTDNGGHVGFVEFGKPYFYSERLMLDFISESL
jgi:predicted alpha/beta-fold hydrolase